jgi:EmrB/QacA subfamily drug resistance transporter
MTRSDITDTTDATRAGPGSGEDGLDPNRWKALWVTLVAGFMILLDVSIVAVALPSMQRGLGTTPAEVQWVVSGYALTFGLALVPAGRLGDAIGRRRMFMISLAGFVLFSALAGAAPSATLLVLARLAQGIAAGALAPQNSALIQQLFRGTERGRAFGFFGATVGISTAAGPVVGGLILALAQGPDGWRWIFYVNVPIGVVALLLAARLIPRTDSGSRGDLDVPGTALLGGAVLALLLPLIESDSGGLTRLWWLFPIAVVLAAAFVVWERRVARHGGEPLLDVRLLTSRPGYGSGVALATIYFIGFSGIWLVFALYFQTGLGYTPLQSGLAVTPFALGSAASSVVGGRLVARLGQLLTVMGLSLVVIGLAAVGVVLAIAPAHAAGLLVVAPLLVAGIGGGWVISPNTTMTLRYVPVASAGSAGGALQTGQRIGSAIGTATITGIFYAVLVSSGGDFRRAVAIAVGGATVGAVVALVVGVLEWRTGRKRAGLTEMPLPPGDHLPPELG